tara:strand:- start:266 stop:850 length:585 start_codon:yes stop_codon:yes gene_type:complete
MKKKILFLGYNNKETSLIAFLKKKNCRIEEFRQKKITKKILKNNFDLIVSFGYNKVISKKILKSIKCLIINLHISYLPFNRGAHPNFWSFVDNTPKGVSIHKIDNTLDNGELIFRKKIFFKNIKDHTFSSTHKVLLKEVEKLFISNFNKIINNKMKKIYTRAKGSFHSKKDLPKSFSEWNVKIQNFLKSYPKKI